MSRPMYNYGTYASSHYESGARRSASAEPFPASVTSSAAAGVGAASASMYPSSLDLLGERYALRCSNFSGLSDYYGYPAVPPVSLESQLVGTRRAIDVLYHQSIMGNIVGQNEDLYSSDMVKRTRYESSLPVYPQRPGEKDCAFYMLTRTCKFGDSCKFDHPIWVPHGGIPDWKEIPQASGEDSLPERPGEPECPFYMKTHMCKFGSRCKFNHPKDILAINNSNGQGVENSVKSLLPERPSEPICSFYAKTGTCKFGSTCKFHHPKNLQLPSNELDGGTVVTKANCSGNSSVGVPITDMTSAPSSPHFFNSKGLPIRQGEVDCPFYMKTGSCKFGASCRYNHPDRTAINPTLGLCVGSAVVPQAANLSVGVLNPAACFQNISLNAQQFGTVQTVYPQRPGQAECDYYMKTGKCLFAERCKFHHPTQAGSGTKQVPVAKLTLAGFPRREGATSCSFYMKTGTCKFGATCKFDHPPPGEAVAMAASHAGTATVTSENNVEKDAAAA